MRPVLQFKLFIAHAAVGIFALAAPASAATFFVNVDLTMVTDITGDQSFATAADDDGAPGGPAIFWDADGVDVIISSGLTMTGGAGGPGGSDASLDGGNIGGFGGIGLYMWKNAGSVTGSGVFVYGGSGGNGSGGGSGGASDTAGGNGGDGGTGIYLDKTNQIALTDSVVQGGKGGNGGDAGDAAGDAANSAKGGVAGQGGAGIALIGSNNAVVTLNNVFVKGGDGASGGTSLANATNANGGNGGIGFAYFGTNATITLGTGTTVQGGLGGAAGTGGTGGQAGSGGHGLLYGGLGGSLTNHGTILAGGNAHGLWIAGTPAAIDNLGTIGAAGASAVRVESGANVTAFTNFSGADISSAASTETMRVNGVIGTFANQGSITNSGSGTALWLSGTIGSFSNSGTISAAGGPALTIKSATVANVIDNTGGTISSSGAGQPTIQIVSDLGADGITFDGGTISHTPGGSAISVSAAQTGAITIKNATVVSGITFSNAGETLNVSGSSLSAGGVFFSGGGNNLNFLSGGTTTLAAGWDAEGLTFFSLLANASVVSNALLTDATSSIGSMMTIAGAQLTLNQSFHADQQVLNQGAITISPSATLSSAGFAGDGLYVIGVTDALTHGRIAAVAGAGSLDFSGASFEIKLTDPTSAFVTGTNFQIAEDLDNDAIAGVANGTVLTDNSALLNFLLYRGDAAEVGLTSDLLFAQVQIALLADIAGEGDDPNSIALGAALDTIGLDGDGDLDDLMLALALLPTNEAINTVLDALLPETDGIAYDIATDMGDQVLDIASKRLDQLTYVNMAAGETKLASLTPIALRGSLNEAQRGAGRFWLQGFGRAVEQGRHGYNTGYDASAAGVALGGDVSVSATTQLGAAFAYADTDADGNGINRTDTEVESYQLVLYGDHVNNEAMYVKAMLGVGWHRNDIARHDVGGIPGNTAGGAYDATQVTARAEAGLAYDGGGTLTLLPRLTANYAYYDADGYSETGVGGLGLTVAPESLSSVRVGLGLLARWDLKLGDGELLQPELRLDYRRDLTRERFETVSEFLGAPGIAFATQGVEPPADILNLGVGALLATAGGVDLRASYDLELKEDYTAHAGYVRASIPF